MSLWLMVCALLSSYGTFALGVTISPSPICTVYTQNSILEHKEQYTPYFIGNAQRYATCTGATWFHGNYLAVLNLYGRKITTYTFDEQTKTFELVHEITQEDGLQFEQPENLVVSPDGSLLAVCSAQKPGITLFRIDQETHQIQPQSVAFIPANNLVHNVRFSADGQFLATAGFDVQNAVCIYKLSKSSDRIVYKLVDKKINTTAGMHAKGINFTTNNTFVVVCYATSVGQTGKVKNMLISYPFNPHNGTIGNPISINAPVKEGCIEDICFIDDNQAILVSDQANHLIAMYTFNPWTGKIGNESIVVLNNPTAQLSFPHGMSISNSGTYLIVTNYGDDAFNLYELSS